MTHITPPNSIKPGLDLYLYAHWTGSSEPLPHYVVISLVTVHAKMDTNYF